MQLNYYVHSKSNNNKLIVIMNNKDEQYKMYLYNCNVM